MADRDDLISMVKAERARAERAEAEVRALTARLDTTHAVIHRYVHGWMPDTEPVGEETFDRWYLESSIDDTDIGGTEPMSPAEAAEIRAATADPTPQTDGDRCPCGARPGETCRPGCPVGPQAGGE